ncbi:MAG: hypothetical protein ABIP02_07760 [Arenimonas sp.]
MFDYNAAENLVLELLARTEQAMSERKIRFAITEVIEQDFGWVFLYEADNQSSADCTPLIVDKSEGVVYIADKASTLDGSLENFRRGNKSRA